MEYYLDNFYLTGGSTISSTVHRPEYGIILGHGIRNDEQIPSKEWYFIIPKNINIYPMTYSGTVLDHEIAFSIKTKDNIELSKEIIKDKTRRIELFNKQNYQNSYLSGSLMPEQIYFFKSDWEESFFFSGVITDSITIPLVDEQDTQLKKYFDKNFSIPYLKQDDEDKNEEFYIQQSTKFNDERILDNSNFNNHMHLSELIYKIKTVSDNQDIPKNYILISCRAGDKALTLYNQNCSITRDELQLVKSTSEMDFHKNFTYYLSKLNDDLNQIPLGVKNSKYQDMYSLQYLQTTIALMISPAATYELLEKKINDIKQRITNILTTQRHLHTNEICFFDFLNQRKEVPTYLYLCSYIFYTKNELSEKITLFPYKIHNSIRYCISDKGYLQEI